MTFEDLRLAEPILRAVIAEGYSVPTPIQAKAIPPVMEGHDLLGCAQTGTGKTAAFALPILHRLSQRPPTTTPPPAEAAQPAAPQAHAPRHGNQHHGRAWNPSNRPHQGQNIVPRSVSRYIRALILAPTRELAAQIGDSFRAYGRNTGLRHTVIFGGVGQHPQTRALRDGVDILVATPGRLLDLMNQGYIDLRAIEIFVLDEADRMLDMGFIHDIRKVAAKLPPIDKRQTLMFSATMPYDIRELASTLLRNPVSIEVAPVSATADRIEQCVYHVDRRDKPALLAHIIKNSPITRAIVFTRTKHGADRLVKQLYHAEIRAEAIHGNKSQNARQRALDNFRTGRSPILIASDIAARGIDIDDISHVFNYDLPDVPETYVHRIGRTARAGASGVAIAFCDAEERSNLRAIERLTKVNIPVKEGQPQYAARPEHREDERSHRDDRRPPRDRRDGHRQRDDRRRDAPRHGGQSHHTAHAPQGGGLQRGGNSQPQSQSSSHAQPHNAGHSHKPSPAVHAPRPAYRSASPSHHAPARPTHTSHATPQHAGQQGNRHNTHAAKPHHASAHSQGKGATPQHHGGKPAHQQHSGKPAHSNHPRDGQHAQQHTQHPRPAQHAPHASKHPHQGKPAHHNKPAQHGQRPLGGKPYAKKH